MSTQSEGTDGGTAVHVVEVHSDGRTTDGRTQELPASADLRGSERRERKRGGNGVRSFSEASTDSVSCQEGTQNNSVATKAKRQNDRTIDRSIEKSEKVNEDHRRTREARGRRLILGGKQLE